MHDRSWSLGSSTRAAAFTVLLSSCGGDGASTSSAPSPSPSPSPAPATGEIFVANVSDSTVFVFPFESSGDIAPTRRLTGANTQLSAPQALFVDRANHELFVANGNGAVTVYSRTANGNTSPLRVLAGAATGLASISGIAVSATRGELYALTPSGVKVFLRTATGNTAPIRSIALPAALTSVIAFAFDAVNDEIVLADNRTVITVPATAGPPTVLRAFDADCGGVYGLDVDPIAGELFLLCAAANQCPPGVGCAAVAFPGIVVHARMATGSASSLRRKIVTQTAPTGAIAVAAPDGQVTWVALPTVFPSPGLRITTEPVSLVGAGRDIAGPSTTLGSGPLRLALGP